MSTTKLKTSVRGLLQEERGGVRLSATLVEVLVKYPVDVAMIQEINEFEAKDLTDVAKEAWSEEFDGATLPGMHTRPAAAWAKNGPNKSELVSSRMSLKSIDDEEEEEDDSVLFGPAGPTTRALRTMAEDKDAQGLSGVRLMAYYRRRKKLQKQQGVITATRVLVTDALVDHSGVDPLFESGDVMTAADLLALAKAEALRGSPITPIAEIPSKSSRERLQAALLTYSILLPFLGNDTLLDETFSLIGIDELEERLSIIEILRRVLLESFKAPTLGLKDILQ